MRTITIRQSTIGDMEFCPARKGYATHPLWDEPVSEQRCFGTVQHALIERSLQGETVDDILFADVKTYIAEIVAEQFAEAGRPTDTGMAAGMVGEAVHAFSAWTETMRDIDLTPLLIEETLEAIIYEDDTLQVVLQGTPDLFTDNIGYDWKTAGRAWKDNKAPYSVQAPLYMHLVEVNYGVHVRQFTYVVYDRRKGAWKLYDTYPSDGFLRSALGRAREYGRQIAAGAFPGTPTVSRYGNPERGWYCSKKWCGAWGFCEFRELPD